MAIACKCGSTSLGDTGTPNCQPIEGVTSRVIGVPLLQEDGTENKIELATYTGDQAEWDLRLNAAEDARYYLTPALGNVTDVRADSTFQTNDSGKSIKLRQGIRNATMLFDKQGGVFQGKLEEWACTDFGIYIIDDKGNLIGNISSDGLFLEPIPVDQDTWDINLIKGVDGTSVQAVMAQFEFDRFTNDSDLRMIEASETEISLLKKTFRGLLDANIVVSNLTTLGFTATVTLDYGSAGTGLPVKGLVFGDFLVDELSPTTGNVPVNVATPTANGVYDVEFTSATTSGDVLSVDIVKNGLDVDAVTTIAVP